MSGTETSAVLAAEQAHLALARAELARMRDRTLALQADGGDPISGAQLDRTLRLRAAALQDDPGTTLFFGRIDVGAECHHIGRRHVSDADGDPVVVDWRAGVSLPFYRASTREPMDVVLRRRFGVDQGELTAYEDEHLLTPDQHHLTDSSTSDILTREIERPRVGPMRDIVATIQPDQDEIVRADLRTTVCVQGAPGTGKTAVGLHRAAWLLYAYRDRLARSGVLVVGPNRSFLEHVGAVLPALGEVTVRHTTVDELVAGGHRVRSVDEPHVAALKGQARMAPVLRAAVWSRVRRADEALVVPRGSRRWRVPAFEVQEMLDELGTRGVRYAAARAMLAQRLAGAVLAAMERSGDTPDDRVQDTVARSRPVQDYVAAVWPALEPRRVLWQLLTTGEGLAPDQHEMRWERPARSPGAARWSSADLVLLDELGDLLERTPSLGHVVLDEAQDLSAMQLRAVGRRAATGSMTVLGDIAQGTTSWSTTSWEESLATLGKPDAHLEVLERGFRVPSAVLDYAARLLPAMAPGLGVPESVRSDPGVLRRHRVPELAAGTHEAVRAAMELPGSVGVVVTDDQVPALVGSWSLPHEVLGAPARDADGIPARVQMVPATLANGLEFDHVVVVEPAAIAAAEPDERTGLRRLYVVLTRAVSTLTVVHARDLPGPLAG